MGCFKVSITGIFKRFFFYTKYRSDVLEQVTLYLGHWKNVQFKTVQKANTTVGLTLVQRAAAADQPISGLQHVEIQWQIVTQP